MAAWGPIGHVQLLRRCPKLIDIVKILPQVGMCLQENYTDSRSNEYSRHYSAESEYLRRQDMNSKLAEEQKKGHHVRRSPNFDKIWIQTKKKVKMIML